MMPDFTGIKGEFQRREDNRFWNIGFGVFGSDLVSVYEL